METITSIRQNTLFSNAIYPILVGSLGFGTLSLGMIGNANIRIWEVLVLYIIAILIVKLLLGKKIIYPNRAAFLIIIPISISIVISGINAYLVNTWLKQTVLLMAMFSLFIIVSQRWSREQILNNFKWIIYPGVLIAMWGIIETLFFPGKLPTHHTSFTTIPRAQSFFAEPNEFSEYLGLPFAFLLSSVLYSRKLKTWQRWMYVLAISTLLLAQILTFSRGGIIVFLSEIMMLLTLSWYYRIGKLSHIRMRNIIYLILILIIITLLLGPDLNNVFNVFVDRIQTLFSGNDPTSRIRLSGILIALNESVKSPEIFLFGIGLGNLTRLLGEGVSTTANLFVDIYTELGVLGLMSFI